MKILRNIILIITTIVFLFPENTFSQKINTKDYNSFSAGIKFGLLPFYGDVRQLKYSADNKFKKTNMGFSLELNKNFNSVFGVKGDLLSGNLSGSSPNLNLHFLTNIFEYSVSGAVNINDLISIYPNKEKLLNFYIYAGIGFVDFRSKVYTYDENNFVIGYGWDPEGLSKTKKTTELVYPVGIGVKYKADPKIDIGLEMTLHMANTDKLDAWIVKNSYKDRYGYAAISFTYKIGNKKEYVDWVNPFQDTTNIFAQNINPITEKTKDTTSKSKTATTKQNSLNTNPTVKSTSKDTVKTITSPVVVKNYYIVSAAYKTKKLAKEAVAKLKDKGFSDAEILAGNKGSYRVSVKSYVTLEEAAENINSIKKSYPYAKILERKGDDEFAEISVKTIVSKNQNNADTLKPKNNKVNTTQNTTVTNKNNSATNNTTTSQTNNNNTTTNKTSTSDNIKTNTTTNQNTNTTSTANNSNTSNNTTTAVIKKFYIIAASYPTEKEAKDAVEMLKTKGFKDAEIVGKNDYGSFRIGYKGYATREDAMKDLTSIKQSINPSAWIFEKK